MNIGIHARQPGVGESVQREERHSCKVKPEILEKLLAFLNSPGNLQQYAFGRQVREIMNSRECVELGKVSRLQNLESLTEKFVKGIMSELDARGSLDLPDDNKRCQKLDPHGSMRQCMKGRVHDGRCNFTPNTSISAITIKQLIKSLTSGDVKSLSGLDDVRVVKGRDNFASLREISKEISLNADLMIKRINNTELFYQTDYIHHLKRSGTHRCNCLTCGFNDKGKSCELESF